MINLETNTNKKVIKMRHILIIFLVIDALICFSVLFFVNNYLDDMTNGEVTHTGTTVPVGATCVSFSFDHRYMHYIQDGILYVWDLKKNLLCKDIYEKGSIDYSYFLDDRNIIVYFVKSDNASNKTKRTILSHNNANISIKTYNLDSKDISDFGSLSINNFQKINQVVYSSVTNVIYVNVSLTGSSKNTIYRINIMKNKEVYQIGKTIKNMVLLGDEDKLFYEDGKGNIYMDRKLLKLPGYDNLQLLGSDADDNIYLLPYGDNEILKVKDAEIVDTIVLENNNFNSIVDNKYGIFLIYDNYAVDITTNANSKIQFDEGNKFLDIFDHTVYTLNNKNKIIIEGNTF